MSVLRELAAFVSGASAAALPEAERAMLRRHVADTLVAAVAGAQTTEGRALRKVLPRASRRGRRRHDGGGDPAHRDRRHPHAAPAPRRPR